MSEAALNSLPFPSRVDFALVDADGLSADCPARGALPSFCPKLDLLSMVNALTEGILVCGADRRVTYANPSAARLLGLPVDALVGRLLPTVVTSAVDEFDASIHEADWPDQDAVSYTHLTLPTICSV